MHLVSGNLEIACRSGFFLDSADSPGPFSVCFGDRKRPLDRIAVGRLGRHVPSSHERGGICFLVLGGLRDGYSEA